MSRQDQMWDFIVVGAGSAGCAAAYGLATGRPGASILVLEAGGSDRSPFIRVAAGQVRAVQGHDWGYRCEADATRAGVSEPWLRGRVVGGSSSINGTMYVQGAPSDFDRWDALCGRSNVGRWCWGEVAPIFREIEDADQRGESRGQGGPLSVRTVRHPHRLTRAFVEASQARGHAFNPDYNSGVQEGVGYAQLSQRRGFRRSAADAFLKPLLRRGRVKLLVKAHAEKVELVGGRATGVRYRVDGVSRLARGREIILAAGAINSPKLLMLSGVGDPEALGAHGIPVRIPRAQVGRNLLEHPLLRLKYRSRIESHNLTGGLPQKLWIAAKFAFWGEGPVSNLFEAATFLKTSPDLPEPDIQLHFMPIGFTTTSEGVTRLADFPAMTVLLNKSHPVSRGRVRLDSADPATAPRIESRLLESVADVDTLVRGIERVREVMSAEPMAAHVAEELTPGMAVQSRDALADFVRRNTAIAFHPAGTCRMGVDPEAVVGPDLKVRGTENLWIADASIMPDLVSGNTNAACMMIGLKLGRQLAAAAGDPG